MSYSTIYTITEKGLSVLDGSNLFLKMSDLGCSILWYIADRSFITGRDIHSFESLSNSYSEVSSELDLLVTKGFIEEY